MTTQEASKKWGISPNNVCMHLLSGHVPGARKVKPPKGKPVWYIPDDAEKPKTVRERTTDLKPQPLSRAEKVEFIRLHGHDKTYAQLKILLGMTHRQIRAVYDDLYERGKI